MTSMLLVCGPRFEQQEIGKMRQMQAKAIREVLCLTEKTRTFLYVGVLLEDLGVRGDWETYFSLYVLVMFDVLFSSGLNKHLRIFRFQGIIFLSKYSGGSKGGEMPSREWILGKAPMDTQRICQTLLDGERQSSARLKTGPPLWV